MEHFTNYSFKTDAELEEKRSFVSDESTRGSADDFSNDVWPSGWWMLPGAIAGALFWFFIIDGLTGFFW